MATIPGAVLCLVLPMHPNNGPFIANLFGRLSCWILGIKVVVHGIEKFNQHAPCVYVSNHQSNWDVPIIGTNYPHNTVVIGKKEILYIPIFGIMFWLTGNPLIEIGRASCRERV